MADTIAHEMSHQWCGNLATMAWWDDLWLNEASATNWEYFGVRFQSATLPAAIFQAVFKISTYSHWKVHVDDGGECTAFEP